MASVVIRKLAHLGMLVLLGGVVTVLNAGSGSTAATAVEGSAKADEQGAECVKPTKWMRRNHMDFIQHQRDKTVREGIRIHKNSLAGCIDCHARKDENHQYVPVNAKGEFCANCHNYVAESLPCFQCHTTVPPTETAQR